ncbi:alpha/beta hydrolase [Pseudomonas putida]|uniref:alpha/beta fold hydrolase n=1 Tax=Pseudomonas putida TaxID=303 RepID=UPI00236390D4|nr:alpha/beta hydrolase [Pseudomonas putida]MDD2068552.1 alpha/beta hydrolase [Pseudomonas putida]HDS1738484.1 alpha/beta hydrolase [Pseudomonas putida]
MTQLCTGDRRVDLTGFSKTSLSVNGIEAVVYRAGQGQPLLFLHGAATWHGFDFARDWTSQFEVIIPYHPGFGPSQSSVEFTTVEHYVAHYDALIKALELPRVHLVGFSLGGWIAAHFAAVHSDIVGRLVLVAPAGLEVPAHPQPDLSILAPDEILSYLVYDLRTLQPYLPDGEDPEFAAMRQKEGTTVAGLLRDGTLNHPRMPQVLDAIRSPTLLIWGQKDRLLPPGQGAAWQQLIAGASLTLFPDAGHLVLDESAAACNEVAAFLGDDRT